MIKRQRGTGKYGVFSDFAGRGLSLTAKDGATSAEERHYHE